MAMATEEAAKGNNCLEAATLLHGLPNDDNTEKMVRVLTVSAEMKQ